MPYLIQSEMVEINDKEIYVTFIIRIGWLIVVHNVLSLFCMNYIYILRN